MLGRKWPYVASLAAEVQSIHLEGYRSSLRRPRGGSAETERDEKTGRFIRSDKTENVTTVADRGTSSAYRFGKTAKPLGAIGIHGGDRKSDQDDKIENIRLISDYGNSSEYRPHGGDRKSDQATKMENSRLISGGTDSAYRFGKTAKPLGAIGPVGNTTSDRNEKGQFTKCAKSGNGTNGPVGSNQYTAGGATKTENGHSKTSEHGSSTQVCRIARLNRDHPELAKPLGAIGPAGRPPKDPVKDSKIENGIVSGGNNSAYRVSRIKRDHPELAGAGWGRVGVDGR